MSYSRLSILKDANDKPVPQYWNPGRSRYEVIESTDGRLRSVLVDVDGSYILTQDLVDQINNQISELARVVENIGL